MSCGLKVFKLKIEKTKNRLIFITNTMKKSILKFTGIGILLFFVVFNSACYETVSNTSGNFKDDSGKTESANMTEDNLETAENIETKGNDETGDMNETSTKKAEGFRGNLSRNLSRSGLNVSDIVNESSVVEKRILDEYGAVFLTKATPPTKVMFTSDAEVNAFQAKAGNASANIGGTTVELQSDAMKALQNAIAEAKQNGLNITPRDGAEAAKRSYEKTLSLWNSRFEPALKHWKSKGRLTDEQIANLKSLPIERQVAEVLELEKQGVYFNTFFNNSILYSVAAPGTSQHLSMLAFDAVEFENRKVRDILAKHGWFRTVQNDEPHFTYLGYKESELSDLGLKKVEKKGGEYWIPNV